MLTAVATMSDSLLLFLARLKNEVVEYDSLIARIGVRGAPLGVLSKLQKFDGRALEEEVMHAGRAHGAWNSMHQALSVKTVKVRPPLGKTT